MAAETPASGRESATTRRVLPLAAVGVLVAGLAAYTWVWYRNAFLTDDAYITFRTLEQFAAGNGLRFNFHERVQAFTHPLWLLLMLPLRLAGVSSPTAAMTLSWLASVAVLVVLWRVARGDRWRWIAAVAIAMVSRTLLDWSSSGLETPLTALLVVMFAAALLEREERGDEGSARPATGLLLLVSALLLTRHDLAPLVAPAAALAIVRRARVAGWSRTTGEGALGLAPFAAWSAFALVYYGSVLPNTALAKLFAGVPASTLGRMGIDYLRVSVAWDPLLLPLLVAAVWTVVRRSSSAGRWLAVGASLHVAYLLRAGGDFMAGRFLVPEAALALALVVACLPRPALTRVALPAVALLGLAWPGSPLRITEHYRPAWQWGEAGKAAIQDTKGFLSDRLSVGLRRGWLERGGWPLQPPCVVTTLGRIGYFASNDQILVDNAALADPFLARLGSQPPWQAGHFLRTVPEGYLDSLASGRDELVADELRPLYDDVRTLTSAPLADARRLAAAWRLWRRPLPAPDLHRCPAVRVAGPAIAAEREIPVAVSAIRERDDGIQMSGVLPVGKAARGWALVVDSSVAIEHAELDCRPSDVTAPLGFELRVTLAEPSDAARRAARRARLTLRRLPDGATEDPLFCESLPGLDAVKARFASEVGDRP